MIDHTSFGAKDFRRAVAFYTACLDALGYAPQRVTSDEAAFGTADRWGFFLYPVAMDKSVVGERNHVAFSAGSRQAIEDFHRIATGLGARSVRPPGGRADISPDYFGAVLTDADGHTIEAVFWSKP